jgi:hypothetical protein
LISGLNSLAEVNPDPSLIPQEIRLLRDEYNRVTTIYGSTPSKFRVQFLINEGFVKPLEKINVPSKLHQSILDIIERSPLLKSALDHYDRKERGEQLIELFTLWKKIKDLEGV